MAAVDQENDTLTYTLSGDDASSFSIDSETGQLKTKAALDYEKKTSYSVTITVSDSSLTDTINVTINVTDVDDNHAPVFTDGESTTRSIAENTGSGVNIGTAIAATDADNDDLTYTLGGTDAGSFSINSTNGQLRTSAALDYDKKTSYSVTINVSDGNGGTDTISVTINIIDVDENRAPVFAEGDSATRSIAETTGSGVNIGTAVSATDADNDDLTYTLGGTDAGSFSINSTTGQLRTNAALNYEKKTSYSVTITVSDGNGGTDTISVTINIIDVDENRAPVFTEGDSATRSIAENTGSGVNIGGAVSVTDADNDTLEYSLGGTDAASFSIDSTSGQLRTKASLDYEMKTTYTVTITVSDGKLTDTINVTINVTNMNEAPVITDSADTTLSIAENTAAGVNIGGTLSATDPDDGDTLTWTIGGTDAASFGIDSETGQLKTKVALDYEKKTSYSVTITVSDGRLTDTINVTINVTDVDDNRAPVFTDGESTTRAIAENTGSGVNIGTAIAATDADNDTLEYSLGGTDAVSFSINSTTGQLRTNAALNYEKKTSYSVTITVSDGNGGTDTISVTINIIDVDENRAPVFTEGDSATRSIAENTGSGVNIGGAVSVTDADNDTLEYSLGGTDAASFSIDSTSGQLRTKASLDYEMKTTHTVTITVSDGKLTDTINVTINVTNMNEAPVITDSADTTLSIAENTAAGVNIGGTLSATDPDDGDTLTWTIGGTDAASFGIDSETGQLKTKVALDYEKKTSYSVTITVSDGRLTDTINVTINVTDVDDNHAPVFTDGESTTRAIDENTAADTNIGTPVAATDANNDTLTYTLGGYNAASFDIDSETGHLKTKAWLDYERKNSYTVTITVSDGSLTDSITVTINVNNVNDAPAFAIVSIVVAGSESPPVTRSVAENTAAGENIGTPVAAVDQENDTLTYTLSGDDASSFSIDSETGQLKTKAALDYEKKTSYSVTITVSDSSLTDTINVTINVTDVDDNRAPVFLLSNITRSIEIDGDTAAGTNIGAPVSATDSDNDKLTYSLSGTDAASFDIDSTTGQLQTTAVFISGTQSVYAVTVTANDGNGGSASVDVTVTATRKIQQVPNSAPVFTDGNSTTRTIDENTAAGENIGTPVAATDANTSDTLTYTLGGTDAASFSIDSTTGQLQTSAALNYETKTSYTVTVSVSDDNGGSDSITVTINVNNVNDAPAFQYGSSIILSVNKGKNLGTSIHATDEDDDTLTYSLSGTDAALFSLDEDYEYHLKSNAALDYDGKTSYSVTITVSDSNGGSDTTTVTITDPAPEVEIWTLIRREEPDWVLKLDTETGIVRAVKSCPRNPSGPSICLFVTSLRPTYFVSFTRAKGVKFDNFFQVTVKFSEEVSDFEQSELTLTNNTAGATISGWESQETWFGYVVDADIDVTMSGSVTFNVAAGAATDNAGQPNPAAESQTITVTIELTDYPPWDVNEDGSVDATDSALVTAALGQTGEDIVNSRTDVNWDDTVDADDVTLVTYHIVDEGEAPSIIRAFSLLDKKTLEKLDPVTLQGYLDILRTESDGSPKYLRVIALLESVLASMRPDKTQLLPNYPNPFNPETWIPYHLAKASDVQITIYDARGTVVRRLDLGHQREGYYTNRSRAAHWDGKNNVGEKVTSGLYFYQLQAGNVSFLRKMVILK